VYCHGTRRKLSFSLGQYTTVFQAEVYVQNARAHTHTHKMRFVVQVSTMGGGLPDLLDDCCCKFLFRSSVISSMGVRSTSIPDVLKGTKKFLVGMA
jgi:hypothetical protein